MKNTILFILSALLFSACSATSKLNSSIKLGEDEPKSYNNLIVWAFTQNTSNRAYVEDEIEKEFRKFDVNAYASFISFPLAGNVVMLSEQDPEKVRTKIRASIKKNKIDGILTIRVVGSEEKEEVVRSSSLSISAPAYVDPYANPYYNNTHNFYDYYDYAYVTMGGKAHIRKSTNYFLQINFYDMASEKLLWTGNTTTKDPESIMTSSTEFAEIIVKEIMRLKVVKP